MKPASKDAGVIYVLLDRFNKQLYPKALEIKQKMNAGQPINEFDLGHLQHVLAELRDLKSLIHRNPEYGELAASIMSLYAQLAKQALENERK